MRHAAVVVLLSAALAGCADAEKAPPPIEPALVQYVLDDVPSDVQHRTLIDFQGKVHLVGYDIDPAGVVAPGARFKLRMYWKSVSRLSAGWSLFTHLVGPGGRFERGELDDVGPLRARSSPTSSQALSPSDWIPGKVYVDEQDIQIPSNARVPEINVMVGVWRLPNLRLGVIGGPSDKEERGIVVTLKTGADWPTPEEQKALAAAGSDPAQVAAPGAAGMPRMQRPPMRLPPNMRPGMPPGAQPGGPTPPPMPPPSPNQGQNR